MFSDGSINIHYRAPACKLLKMNTLNEFEVNRLRRLYGQQAQREQAEAANTCRRGLQRSKSSRLAPEGRHWAEQACGIGRHFRLATSGQQQSQEPLQSPYVDLQRYQRALAAKGSLGEGSRGWFRRPPGSTGGQRFGRALFDFQARNGQELSLGKGDLVELLEVLVEEPQWARVEDCQSGLQGLVPISYVDFSVGCALAKRDVGGSRPNAQLHRTAALGGAGLVDTSGLLPMSKGEPITLLRRHQGHWYEASNTRKACGLVWSNDLEIIKQPLVGVSSSPGAEANAENRPRPRSAGPCGHPFRPSSGQSFSEDDSEGRQAPVDVEMRPRKEEHDEYSDEEEEMYILESGERLLASRPRRNKTSSHQSSMNLGCSGAAGTCCRNQPPPPPAGHS